MKPTIKQRRALQAMVENGGVVSRAMITAGYSKNTAVCPHKLTNSKAYKDLLAEYGLTEELIVTSLVEDIKKKPQNRKPELELGAKIGGMLIERIEQKQEITIKDFSKLNDDELNKLIVGN